MNKLLLLVEDDPTDELLALRAFKNRGAVDIVVVHDGTEALDFLFGTGPYAGRDVSRLPSLILLDGTLPRMSGLDVLTRLRADARTRWVPIVILSGSADTKEIWRSYQHGANAYVRKPSCFPDLARAADAITLFWLGLNEPPRAQAGV